jgi:predicted  nucleic acid-binding Zn-ribbon protein
MNRIDAKIEKLKNQIYEIEDRIDFLEKKKKRYSRKRDRKAYRKRMRDPLFRMTQNILKNVCEQLYEFPSNASPYKGLKDIL